MQTATCVLFSIAMALFVTAGGWNASARFYEALIPEVGLLLLMFICSRRSDARTGALASASLAPCVLRSWPLMSFAVC